MGMRYCIKGILVKLGYSGDDEGMEKFLLEEIKDPNFRTFKTGEKLGIKDSNVSYWLSKLGIKCPKSNITTPAPKKVTIEKLAELGYTGEFSKSVRSFLRDHKNFTKSELAKKSGFTVETISNWRKRYEEKTGKKSKCATADYGMSEKHGKNKDIVESEEEAPEGDKEERDNSTREGLRANGYPGENITRDMRRFLVVHITEKGMSIHQVARLLKISRELLSFWIRRLNISVDPADCTTRQVIKKVDKRVVQKPMSTKVKEVENEEELELTNGSAVTSGIKVGEDILKVADRMKYDFLNGLLSVVNEELDRLKNGGS